MLKYEPADTAFETVQVLDNKVSSEATDTGPRFIYETVFGRENGEVFKLESATAPPAAEGPVCAEILTGALSGKLRYAVAALENCS